MSILRNIPNIYSFHVEREENSPSEEQSNGGDCPARPPFELQIILGASFVMGCMELVEFCMMEIIDLIKVAGTKTISHEGHQLFRLYQDG